MEQEQKIEMTKIKYVVTAKDNNDIFYEDEFPSKRAAEKKFKEYVKDEMNEYYDIRMAMIIECQEHFRLKNEIAKKVNVIIRIAAIAWYGDLLIFFHAVLAKLILSPPYLRF